MIRAVILRQELRKFIIDNYMKGFGSCNLSDDDSFLRQGIIDSVGVIELTNFVQRDYDIKIEVTEIMPENFDTINNLERYINKKLGAR